MTKSKRSNSKSERISETCLEVGAEDDFDSRSTLIVNFELDPNYVRDHPSVELRHGVSPTGPQGKRQPGSDAKKHDRPAVHARSETKLFRPELRPPMAILKVFDDNQTSGEQFRLRRDQTAIGRAHCDLVIPHDDHISQRHVQIERLQADGDWTWILRDLNSRNGTFLLVKRLLLKHLDEVMLGRCWLRFCLEPILEISCVRHGTRFKIEQDSFLIGRSALHCNIPGMVDDFLEQRHAHVQRQANGKWILEDQHSRNGVWARVHRAILTDGCTFRVGEQRLWFHIP